MLHDWEGFCVRRSYVWCLGQHSRVDSINDSNAWGSPSPRLDVDLLCLCSWKGDWRTSWGDVVWVQSHQVLHFELFLYLISFLWYGRGRRVVSPHSDHDLIQTLEARVSRSQITSIGGQIICFFFFFWIWGDDLVIRKVRSLSHPITLRSVPPFPPRLFGIQAMRYSLQPVIDMVHLYPHVESPVFIRVGGRSAVPKDRVEASWFVGCVSNGLL